MPCILHKEASHINAMQAGYGAPMYAPPGYGQQQLPMHGNSYHREAQQGAGYGARQMAPQSAGLHQQGDWPGHKPPDAMPRPPQAPQVTDQQRTTLDRTEPCKLAEASRLLPCLCQCWEAAAACSAALSSQLLSAERGGAPDGAYMPMRAVYYIEDCHLMLRMKQGLRPVWRQHAIALSPDAAYEAGIEASLAPTCNGMATSSPCRHSRRHSSRHSSRHSAGPHSLPCLRLLQPRRRSQQGLLCRQQRRISPWRQ